MEVEKKEFIRKASCSECRKWGKVAQWRLEKHKQRIRNSQRRNKEFYRNLKHPVF
jgi:hypothetical protein